jgi:ABC-type multidrug transport system fused ATPase/permease subunit
MKMRGDGRKAKDPKKTFFRLLGYMKPYLPRLILMVVCIILSTAASVAGNGSLERLIEDFIKPMLKQETPDFAPLIGFLCMMGGIYLTGMIATFLGYVFCDISRLWSGDENGMVAITVEGEQQLVTNTSGLIPVAVMAAAAVVMLICGLLMKKLKWKWLNDYALPISLVLGMLAAIPITAWLG